jgi:hypothetical protein
MAQPKDVAVGLRDLNDHGCSLPHHFAAMVSQHGPSQTDILIWR